MRVIVLGGAGFCGGPASLRLSAAGHQVLIIDDLSRRAIDDELGASSLTPLSLITERLREWTKLTGHSMAFQRIDVSAEYDLLLQAIAKFRPDTIVHFAEQRAAPYSMKSGWHKRYTVNRNLTATHNVLCAIVESEIDVHLVHLGTMGVYGYTSGGFTLPEGYLRVLVPDDAGELLEREILHPANPGSIYHMTKTQDQLFFYFYNRNDGVRITDLHQGIVWGTNTRETALSEALINRFDYDGDYGTVLNRFLVQAAIGERLTVHGTGGQTRAFIHIEDSAQCIKLAVETPPAKGERVRIFNQLTETHRVRDLAHIISRLTGAEVAHVPNPRVEAEENELAADNRCLLGLGLKPTFLEEGLLLEIRDIAAKYGSRIDKSRIPCTSKWRRDEAVRGKPEAPAKGAVPIHRIR
jgi:UDP-sulfoquinovose synthase